MIFHIYVLKSQKNGKRYIGYTAKDPRQRLNEHNSGSNSWTRYNGPFVLVREEEFASKFEARKRELFLKSGQGRKFLDQVLLQNVQNHIPR